MALVSGKVRHEYLKIRQYLNIRQCLDIRHEHLNVMHENLEIPIRFEQKNKVTHSRVGEKNRELDEGGAPLSRPVRS